MTDHNDHNAFVTKAMLDIGPGLIAQGNYAKQLVAVESIFAGMIAFVAKANGMNHFKAETNSSISVSKSFEFVLLNRAWPLVAGTSQISPKDANPTKILDAPTLTDLARNILENLI